MAVTYTVSPVSNSVVDGATGTTTPVVFNITRSDASAAASVAWSLLDDPAITHAAEQHFFANPTLASSGTLNFAAGVSTAQVKIDLVGGINTLLGGYDWGEFDLGIKLGVTGAAGSGFSQTASGGYGVTTNNYLVNGTGGTLSLNYDMYTIPDEADVYVNGTQVLTTGGPVSGASTLTYAGPALKVNDDVRVVIIGNIQGTLWDYTINYAPGLTSVVEGHVLVDTGPPGVTELARASKDAYGYGSPINGYKPLSSQPIIDAGYAGFRAVAYANEDNSRIIIAFRGTNPTLNKSLAKNIFSDTSFVTGLPSLDYLREIKDAVAFVSAIRSTYSSATVTLTGHSLGGAVAQTVGQAGHYSTVGFDAPGGAGFYTRRFKP